MLARHSQTSYYAVVKGTAGVSVCIINFKVSMLRVRCGHRLNLYFHPT